MAKIITKIQEKFLKLFSKSTLVKQFYFSGGTALSYYYLNHRYSEDLDFFSEEEFDTVQISVFLKSIKKEIGYLSFDYQQSFNRNIYHLRFKDSVLKVEFTYYPFNQVQKPKKNDGIMVDSLIDIATNKLFTISQNARGRDYFDLYYINQKEKVSLEKLRKLAKIKFDWHVDPLHLGTQLNRVKEFIDDPILTKKVSKKKIIKFFEKEASNLGKEVIK